MFWSSTYGEQIVFWWHLNSLVLQLGTLETNISILQTQELKGYGYSIPKLRGFNFQSLVCLMDSFPDWNPHSVNAFYIILFLNYFQDMR